LQKNAIKKLHFSAMLMMQSALISLTDIVKAIATKMLDENQNMPGYSTYFVEVK